IACNQQRSDKVESSSSADTMEVAAVRSANGPERFGPFLDQLAQQIPYDEEALRAGKQGTVSVTFEKEGDGHIAQISVLNELWTGQREEITKALQSERVDRLAPVGKYLASIAYRIPGDEGTGDDMAPPPPPVPADYTPINTLVIMGQAPNSAPRPASTVKATRVTDKQSGSEKADVGPPVS